MKKPSLAIPVLIALAIVGVFLLLSVERSGLPQAGDVVSPRPVQEIRWEPGEEGQLWVELAATNQSGDSRRLGFAASPKQNPVALVNFSDADGKRMSPSRVELSQRC